MQKHLLLLALWMGVAMLPVPALASCGRYCGSNIDELNAYSPNYGGRHYYNDRYSRYYLEDRVRGSSPHYRGQRHYYKYSQPRFLENQVGDYSSRSYRPTTKWSDTSAVRKSIPRGEGWSWNPSSYLK
ncbi:MAG: hypothetical protein J0L97_02150 [Alphaproteobacteria bacterium]|nr:hypothetical protein [Alphaproteobacteria bacterium]